MGTLGKVIFGVLGFVVLIIILYYAAAVYLAGSVINALGDAAASSKCTTTTLADGSQKTVCSDSQSNTMADTKPLTIQTSQPVPPPSTCNNVACNTVMKSYIDKYWAFENSATIFGECKGCPSRWYLGGSSSIDGKTWVPTPTGEVAYKTLMLV